MSKPKRSTPPETKQRAEPRRSRAGGIDLATINVDVWLIRKVKSTRNTTPLIEHLRAGRGPMGADLRTFIADLLEGKVKATPKRKTLRDSGGSLVRGTFDYWKREIREAIAEGGPRYKDLEHKLKWAEFSGVAETKGQITAAAKCITQALYGITKDQLEGFLINRRRNAKLRTNKSREK